ncbi:nitrilase-related carbon-nitrogen hydrolase, partial [Mycolicibacterium celeriflavum]|uniref:nitrilase-related carbon-nitrogen hydrolase n=1 Tax=Mycolicibacterium celeriflavum TaxID=1249101 RepID=UPI000B326631
MRIALAQILSGTEPSENLALVDEYTRRAADAGARMVLFPEATMCRFGVPLAPVAEPLDGPWASEVRAIAERAGIVVVAGMFVPSGDGRVLNTLIATGPASDGHVDAHYEKIHLYDAFGFQESKTVAPGRAPVVIDVDGVRVGLTLCYDVRFPELYV